MLVQIPNLISSVATDSNKLTFLLDSVNPYQLKTHSEWVGKVLALLEAVHVHWLS
jgi:hypothetical protein